MGLSNTSPSVDQTESTRLRLTFLALLVVSLLVLLFARLWFLQVMAGETYAELAAGNAVRTITTEAPRGRLLDRDGEVLVGNRYAKVVSVQPAEMGEEADEIIAELAGLLGEDAEEIAERIEHSRVSPFRPKPIAVDVPEETVFYIHEHRASRFPGVYAETLPLRDYEYGPLGAHVLGYVGEISAEQLDSPEYEDYRAGERIGWSGVEASYQDVLRGVEGQRRLEVNARGEVLRDLSEDPPVPGDDLALTLDLEAQQISEEALAEGIDLARQVRDPKTGPQRGGTFNAPAGAAVVMDPANGDILAMASYPTFEPQQFVGGISTEHWEALNSADNHFPLINRATHASYPPGSVWKVVPAAAALEEGFMGPQDTLPCPPSWSWGPSTYRNWKTTHSGDITLKQALVESCDTVFYELARDMWEREQGSGAEREYLTEYGHAFGFGKDAGLNLPGVGSGVVPGREWKREFWLSARNTYCSKARTLEEGSYAQEVNADLCETGDRWRGGDAVNMSIGQGDTQTTPLQVANAFAAIANGGQLWKPRIAKGIVEPDGSVAEEEPELLGELPVNGRNLDLIHDGLVGVTAQDGTASSVFADFPVAVAGKTGTAELQPKQPFAWFASYAPADDPEYAVAVLLEEGGGGSQTAAPIARRILEGLLDAGESALEPGEETETG